MKRMLAMLVMTVAGAGLAMGQTLPAGHPPLGDATKSGAATLPAGHPPMGKAGTGTGKMPAGHPSMEEMMAAGATTQMSGMNFKGKLTLRFVPGTAGGKLVEGTPVTIELLDRGMLVRPADELKMDKDLKVVLEEVPVMPPVQARVTVKHAGFPQQINTPVMSPRQSDVNLEVKVYDTTEKKPAWKIKMAHVLVQRMEDGGGVRVTQYFMPEAEGDAIWIGEKVGEERVTMSIPLPAGADAVSLKGFDDAATKLVDGKLVTGGALFPGESDYQFAYTLKAKDRQVAFSIAAPADVTALMVAVPGEGLQVKATGMADQGVREMGEGAKTRMFSARDLKAGESVTLALSNLKSVAELETKPSMFTVKNVSLGGAFLMVLVAAGYMMMRKPAVPVAK